MCEIPIYLICTTCGEELSVNYDYEGDRCDECPNVDEPWHKKLGVHVRDLLTKFVHEMHCDAITSYPRSKEWTQGVEWVIRRAKTRLKEI